MVGEDVSPEATEDPQKAWLYGAKARLNKAFPAHLYRVFISARPPAVVGAIGPRGSPPEMPLIRKTPHQQCHWPAGLIKNGDPAAA